MRELQDQLEAEQYFSVSMRHIFSVLVIYCEKLHLICPPPLPQTLYKTQVKELKEEIDERNRQIQEVNKKVQDLCNER